ncbi:transporter substrate-binding domain-containing protein [Solwaraspora sp. WMMD406]|uniref:substrate-binding periplasmic protein n=1 Tax=Solwaraspora sp. WMMD406 TaxID=3016095 RepID=UPI002417747A|nr:transporter substrate-binding domain-containing protein [Solwaraspora sp. WMMD406]MDG4763994.1 transporter substrate-binding domain-containing protein [Solwaraspora sp. WMMD406]
MTRYPVLASKLLRPLRAQLPVIVLVVVVALAAVVVIIGLRPSPTAPARPVIVTSGAWAPFVGPDLPRGGPITELVVAALTRSGYSPEITYTSWSLAEEQVAAGAAHAVFPLVASSSRRDAFLLSDPLIDFEYVLFYDSRAGTPQVDGPDDLAALRVGGITGYDYWAELDAAVPELVRFESTLEGFQALADGRIDLLAEGLLSGHAVLTDPSFAGDAADFTHLRDGGPVVRSVQGLHLMMPDTAEAATVLRRFNLVLGEMRQGEEYADLVAGLDQQTPDRVTLEPADGSGLVELLDPDGRLALVAPRGTRAQVLDWPEVFVGPSAAPSAGAGEPNGQTASLGRPILVPVKIVNGPAQGRVFHVDARFINLDGADQ